MYITFSAVLLLLLAGTIYSQDYTPSALDKVLSRHTGIYQSIEACHVSMPRFTDLDGPMLEVNIMATNEFRSDITGSMENQYYIQFDYREDYSGQNPEINHHQGFAQIIDAKEQGNIIYLTLNSMSYSEYFDQEESDRTLQEFEQQFQMTIEVQNDGKVKIKTLNPPKICPLCWKFDGIVLFPLLWSLGGAK